EDVAVVVGVEGAADDLEDHRDAVDGDLDPVADVVVQQVEQALARDRLVVGVEHRALDDVERVRAGRGAHRAGGEGRGRARQQGVELGPGVVGRDLRVAGELRLLGVDGLAARVDGQGGREVDPGRAAGEPVEGGPAGQR